MTERSRKTGDTGKVVPLPRAGRRSRACPVCRAPAVHRYRPFCSKRCADIDLGRWLKGGYAIPTEEAPQSGEHDEIAEGRDEPQDSWNGKR